MWPVFLKLCSCFPELNPAFFNLVPEARGLTRAANGFFSSRPRVLVWPHQHKNCKKPNEGSDRGCNDSVCWYCNTNINLEQRWSLGWLNVHE